MKFLHCVVHPDFCLLYSSSSTFVTSWKKTCPPKIPLWQRADNFSRNALEILLKFSHKVIWQYDSWLVVVLVCIHILRSKNRYLRNLMWFYVLSKQHACKSLLFWKYKLPFPLKVQFWGNTNKITFKLWISK